MNPGNASQAADELLFVLRSPRSWRISTALLGFGSLWAVAVVVGVNLLGMKSFVGVGPCVQVSISALLLLVLVSSIGIEIAADIAKHSRRTFFVHRDRIIEVEGTAVPRKPARCRVIGLATVRHLELMSRGRIAIRSSPVGGRGFKSYVMAAGRLHAEDRFDQLLECVEAVQPGGLYSIRQRREPAQSSRPWTWAGAFPGSEDARDARLWWRAAVAGEQEFVIQPGRAWSILASGTDGDVLLRGNNSEITDDEGFVLGDVTIGSHGGWRVRFGCGEEFHIAGWDGNVTRDGEESGRVDRTFPQHWIEVEPPLPALMLLAILAAGSCRDLDFAYAGSTPDH